MHRDRCLIKMNLLSSQKYNIPEEISKIIECTLMVSSCSSAQNTILQVGIGLKLSVTNNVRSSNPATSQSYTEQY